MQAPSDLLSTLGWLLSPTRKIIDHLKQGDREKRGLTLRKWSFRLFTLEILAFCGLCLLLTTTPNRAPGVLAFLVLIYPISRINEIAYAFIRDPLSTAKESDLCAVDRVKMAMRSYFGLAFNFAAVYYFLPIDGLFKDPISSFFESFYFSGVTVATLGYGDILPVHWLSRALALYEVAIGILIAAVAIGTYISGIKASDA